MIGPTITPAAAAQVSASMPASVFLQGSGQASGAMSRPPAERVAGRTSATVGPDGVSGVRPRAGLSDPISQAATAPRAAHPAAKASQSPDALWKAARDFEAMVIGQLLQPMFETVDNSKSPFSGGHGEKAFKPMIVEEMAKKIAAGGGFGLAQPIYAQMLRMQEGARP